jgi:hypothetical protein
LGWVYAGGVVGGHGGGGAGPARGGGGTGDGRGQGGAPDALPREKEEQAVREDHPLRVAQGLRRDAAADQGPLRQAHGQRRRRGRRPHGVVLRSRLRIQRRAHLLILSRPPRALDPAAPCPVPTMYSR